MIYNSVIISNFSSDKAGREAERSPLGVRWDRVPQGV